MNMIFNLVKNKWKNIVIILFISSAILCINYVANYACGKFTDSMVEKDLHSIIYFLWLCIILWILSPIFSHIRDYLIRQIGYKTKNELYKKYNAESNKDIDIFSNLCFKLPIRFLESFASIIVFIFVLFKVAGLQIICLVFVYSIFIQIVEFYLSKLVDKSKFKQKTEVVLFIVRDICNYLKGYVPYFILIVPYLQDLITLGDATKSIVAFKYVARGLTFFIDNRANLTQLKNCMHNISNLGNYTQL